MDSDYLVSPLRYPGGKSKVARKILPFIPNHTEYREPFVGGGGIFFAKPKAQVNWINDSHPGLYAFYLTLRDEPDDFLDLLREQASARTPESLWEEWTEDTLLMKDQSPASLVERGMQYYVINRLVWSGRVCYDPRLKSRLFFSNPTGLSNIDKRIEHLRRCSEKLRGVMITCFNVNDPEACPTFYSTPTEDEDIFIYMDPPYLRDCEASPTSRLYEKGMTRGEHLAGIDAASQTKSKVLLSYEDTPEVRELFAGHPWHIIPLSWTYCGRHGVTKEATANGTKEVKPIGKELLICNYDIPEAARSLVSPV